MRIHVRTPKNPAHTLALPAQVVCLFSSHRRRRAFSLIEMMLALSIFSVMALSLYGTFASGISLSKRSEKDNEFYRQMHASLVKMSREMEQMVDFDFRRISDQMRACSGESGRITFLSPTAQGLKFVTYRLEELEFGSIHKTIVGQHFSDNVSMVLSSKETRATYALIREMVDFEDLAGESPKGTALGVPEENKQVRFLSDNIISSGLKFRYAYKEGDGQDMKIVWKDTWALPHIPRAIRLEVAFYDPRNPDESLIIHRNVFVPAGVWGEEI